jgi:hypothetical protein
MVRMAHTPLLSVLLAAKGSQLSYSEIDPSTEGCTDISYSMDFADLEAGRLSSERLDRLAGHMVECENCRGVFALMLNEERTAEGTGQHRHAPARELDKRQELGKLQQEE